jgi:hypothetical protein
MVGVEGKSMLGEAAEKLGFKGREDRGVGAQTADAEAQKEKEEDGPPVVAALKNRAGESRSPYVSFAGAVKVEEEVEVEEEDDADCYRCVGI